MSITFTSWNFCDFAGGCALDWDAPAQHMLIPYYEAVRQALVERGEAAYPHWDFHWPEVKTPIESETLIGPGSTWHAAFDEALWFVAQYYNKHYISGGDWVGHLHTASPCAWDDWGDGEGTAQEHMLDHLGEELIAVPAANTVLNSAWATQRKRLLELLRFVVRGDQAHSSLGKSNIRGPTWEDVNANFAAAEWVLGSYPRSFYYTTKPSGQHIMHKARGRFYGSVSALSGIAFIARLYAAIDAASPDIYDNIEPELSLVPRGEFWLVEEQATPTTLWTYDSMLGDDVTTGSQQAWTSHEIGWTITRRSKDSSYIWASRDYHVPGGFVFQ